MLLTHAQPAILLPLPPLARYLSFRLKEPRALTDCLIKLRDSPLLRKNEQVVGLGQTLVAALNGQIAGLKHAPAMTAPGLFLAEKAEVLWIWLRGDDRGDLLHRSRALTALLAPALAVEEILDAFQYQEGRDLSGFEDGTENPVGEKAIEAAIVDTAHPRLAGSSFVATQRWQHDFARFDAMSKTAKNDAIGRHQQSNEELDAAPSSAHVKRTAQESFAPEAFVLRRSMPWAEGNDGGLMFVAFGKSFDAFEAQLARMTGREDGVLDALFSFTQPLSTAYFWCPALKNGRLDLSPLGL